MSCLPAQERLDTVENLVDLQLSRLEKELRHSRLLSSVFFAHGVQLDDPSLCPVEFRALAGCDGKLIVNLKASGASGVN